jgi:hypothetical protein
LPVGTDEPLTAPVSVGPNPVNDVLEVKTDLSDYSATLTNALGQVVDRSTALSGFTRINTGSLPAGAYQLTIVSDGKQRSFKIVK